MKTAFYSLLENETRPHIIFGHIHRRQNEIECVLVKTGSTEFEALDDEQVLDLVICSAFAARVSNSEGRTDIDVFRAAVDRIDARPHRRTYEVLGRVLGSRIIGPEQHDEYRAIMIGSMIALHAALATDVAA
jgi:hypothetical protein